MKTKSITYSTLLALALTTSTTLSAPSLERCADVIKGGKNSCAVKSLGISCQGQATDDNMVGAWIKVPYGTCLNIIPICEGAVNAPEGTKPRKLAKACNKIADQNDHKITGGRLVDRYGESI